jgi:hypothetical protein
MVIAARDRALAQVRTGHRGRARGACRLNMVRTFGRAPIAAAACTSWPRSSKRR